MTKVFLLAHLARIGYNKDKIYVPQINLALLYSTKGLPAMIRALPGSVRDIVSLYNTVEEIKASFNSEFILILDRGFFSQNVIKFLLNKRISFVIPAKRNSKLYPEIKLNEHFFYRERLIKAGKIKDKYYLYVFEDLTLRTEEETNLYKMFDEGKISKEELNKKLERAGKILLISNMDAKPEKIFLMYKQRGTVEKAFDVYKNLLHADRMYLQSEGAVFGHIFVSFLALYVYCRLQQMLRNVGLLDKISPMGYLRSFPRFIWPRLARRRY